MLTMADKGGRGGLDLPILADLICEGPLYRENRMSPIQCFVLFSTTILPRPTVLVPWVVIYHLEDNNKIV